MHPLQLSAVAEIGWDEVRARRLARSSLSERASSDRLVEVVGALCGVHAQVQACGRAAARCAGRRNRAGRRPGGAVGATVARQGLDAARNPSPPPRRRAAALARGAARRPALGRPGSARAWRDPAGDVHPALGAARSRRSGRRSGRCWTAAACCARSSRRRSWSGSARGPRERLRSGFAFFLADLCQGPPQGARITLARPDQWIDGWQESGRGRSPCAMCAAGSSAPTARAGQAELCQWLASPAFKVPEAWLLFDELATELEEIDVEGRRCFVLAGDRSFPRRSTSGQRCGCCPSTTST